MSAQPRGGRLDQSLLEEVLADVRSLAEEAARSEPEDPEQPDPRCLALATCDLQGVELHAGDADQGFPIQSVVKVFALTLALAKVGDDLWERVGKEPSGDPYNSLVLLEREQGVPSNPLINAGALVVADVLVATCPDPRQELLDLLALLSGETVEIDQEALQAEEERSHRNRASAHLMSSFENLNAPVDQVIDLYAQACSVRMSARQLARAMRFLAHDGVEPASGERVVSEPLARRLNAVMLTCGTYDSAGEFAYEVGFPCKSGIAGAIVGDVPDRLGVCAWSPPLDENGNSHVGRVALHLLAERADLSIF